MFEAVRKARADNEKGFTLIELMIVVAIIGILAAIAIPQFSAYRERAYIASMKADCHSVKLAEETYFADHDKYVTTSAPGTTLADYGFKNVSAGNSVVVTAGTGGLAKAFIATITDSVTGRTGKSVVYTSTTGQTVTN
jgi:prepilin-type N-terminal cleavage/methylation domain-containing protein